MCKNRHWKFLTMNKFKSHFEYSTVVCNEYSNGRVPRTLKLSVYYIILFVYLKKNYVFSLVFACFILQIIVVELRGSVRTPLNRTTVDLRPKMISRNIFGPTWNNDGKYEIKMNGETFRKPSAKLAGLIGTIY